jgi:hypothetical protein
MGVVADVASNVKLLVVSMLKYEQMVKFHFVIPFPSLNSMLKQQERKKRKKIVLRNLVQGGRSFPHGEALHASLHIKCEALQQLLCALNRLYYASFTPSFLRKLYIISCTSITQRTNELE